MSEARTMTKEDAVDRIDDLRRQVEHHRFQYYVLDKPEISDADFDKLFRELQQLEESFPELITPGSPTQKVGAAPSTEFKQIKHRIPMLSLANAMSADDLDKWGERIARGLDLSPEDAEKLRYVCELKIDGLSIALTYKNGHLDHGATRGNGDVGEDVTLNLKTIESLPQKLTAKNGATVPELLEVRGEVYMPISSFDQLNKALTESGQPTFANPRNAASGGLRQKDPRNTAKRKLAVWTYFAYVTPSSDEPRTHEGTLELLQNLGLPVNKERAVVQGMAGVKKFCDDFFDRRHSMEYQTDGVVIKLDERSLWGQLGTTSHSPRWAIAYKYPPDEEETIVEKIEFDIGRTGAVTPAACLKPVQLAGTTVKRATLHNFEQIRRLDVRVGDTVVVRKAGEIIPEVLRVVTEKRPANSVPVQEPHQCPVCEGVLERIGTEVALRCINPMCPAQTQRRLEHWVSRDALDIEGLGEVLIRNLLEAGLIKDPADLYELTEEKLSRLERMGQKSAQKILANIEKSKTRPLGSIIFGLGIRHVGAQMGDALADQYDSLQAIIDAANASELKVEGVGPAISEAIKEFSSHPENRRLIERLQALGVQLEQKDKPAKPAAEQTLTGKTFVLTGTLETMDRSDAEKLIKAHGGKTSSSVSKKTDYVLAGANAGSKLQKAQELGITIIDEAQFKDLLGGAS